MPRSAASRRLSTEVTILTRRNHSERHFNIDSAGMLSGFDRFHLSCRIGQTMEAGSMRHTETVIFKTDWGWVGLAAVENGSGAGICRVVLPSASKKTVQRVLEAHLRARAEAQDTRRENR